MSTLLTTISAATTLRRASSREYAGACPLCGGDPQTSDRLRVFVGDGKWWCRKCDQGGDEVAWMRKVEGMSCPEAHAAAGKRCASTTCPAAAKCSQGSGQPAAVTRRRLEAPVAEASGGFCPQEHQDPQTIWRTKAAALVEYAHQALLGNADQLAYLAGRGLDRASVERFRLGYLPQDLFRQREAWGLATELREDGHQKKLLIPAGIVIPYFDEGGVHRVRIRRAAPPAGHGRYYWLPGSGNDVVVIGAPAQAFVVVESDLDALLVAAAAGDLVGAVPLGSVAVKPKASAAEQLAAALCILVALDSDEAGEQSAPWWSQQYRRAHRWPVPAGKDPGEFVAEHAGDIRQWVVSGLQRFAPVLTMPVSAPPAAQEPRADDDQVIADQPAGGCGEEVILLRKTARHGIEYAVVADDGDLAAGREQAPGCVLFTLAEIERCRGMSAEEADAVMVAKAVFFGATVKERVDG